MVSTEAYWNRCPAGTSRAPKERSAARVPSLNCRITYFDRSSLPSYFSLNLTPEPMRSSARIGVSP